MPVEPGQTATETAAEPKRNEPCPCGSGKKYKNCSCSDKARVTTRIHNMVDRIPMEARAALPYFVNWLLEDLPTLHLAASLSPVAWDTLVLQSIHNKCLMDLQARAAKDRATVTGLQQEQSALQNRLAEIDQQQARIADQADIEATKQVAIAAADAQPEDEPVPETPEVAPVVAEEPSDVSSET